MSQRRFRLQVRVARRGDIDPSISDLQAFLARFGYLRTGAAPGRLDNPTSRALARFQRVARLRPTGELDRATASAVEAPRCSLPDTEISAGPAAYVLVGCSYERSTFTYRFINGTTDVAGDAERAAVIRAFNTWANALCGVRFEQSSTNADFDVGWFTGDHGDGAPFDGAGNVIAHAFFPPPCGGSLSSTVHFDDAETWSVSGGLDVETVALHEIGHGLGLGHSSDPASIMYPTYTGVRRVLGADDLAGIRRLYPMLCRTGVRETQAGPVDEIDSVRGASSAQLVNAVRMAGRLQILSWSVASSGAIVLRGSSGSKAGEATSITIARNGASSQYLTACRAADGKLLVIAWNLSADGTSITRLGSRLGNPVSRIAVANVANGLFVTAARNAGGELRLETWRLDGGGVVTRIAGSAAGEVSEVSIAKISTDRIVTAVRAGDGRLLLIAWRVTSGGVVTRIGSARDVASTRITVAIDASGNPVTAARDAGGNLRLTTWRVDASGAVVRRRSSTEGGPTSEHDLAFALGHVVTSARVQDGTIKTILWSTTASGVIARVGDSAWLGEPGSRPSVSLEMVGPSVVTSVRASNGHLRLTSWQR